MTYVIVVLENDQEEDNQTPDTELFGPFQDGASADSWVRQIQDAMTSKDFSFLICSNQWPPGPKVVAEYLEEKL